MPPDSPLKARPLRNPGQSLDERIQREVEEGVLGFLGLVLAVWLFVLFEWLRHFGVLSLGPLMWTLLALAVTLYAGFKLVRVRQRLAALRLGRDGERAVGQYLEGLRVDGARVFHDVPAQGFNLDHVVICTRGVFVIETKTRSKPTPGARVRVSGDEVWVGNRVPERNPVTQVRAAAKWLDGLLRESTGRAFQARGVVAFPGWFVEHEGRRGDVWVLEPKALPAFIDAEPPVLTHADVALAAYHLSRYVRASEAESR